MKKYYVIFQIRIPGNTTEIELTYDKAMFDDVKAAIAFSMKQVRRFEELEINVVKVIIQKAAK